MTFDERIIKVISDTNDLPEKELLDQVLKAYKATL